MSRISVLIRPRILGRHSTPKSRPLGLAYYRRHCGEDRQFFAPRFTGNHDLPRIVSSRRNSCLRNLGFDASPFGTCTSACFSDCHRQVNVLYSFATVGRHCGLSMLPCTFRSPCGSRRVRLSGFHCESVFETLHEIRRMGDGG